MENNKVNVLIYPSGGENAINIFNALKYNIHFQLFGASMNNNYSSLLYDKNHYYEGDLSIKNPNFLIEFNSVLKKFKIQYILCTHDEVIAFLMKNQNKINATICTSPLDTTLTAENKYLTYEKFKDKDYSVKVYNIDEKIEYPAFLKPYIGAGGKNTTKVSNQNELLEKYKDNMLICEYLPGDEFTVDCFTDRKGNLIFSKARTRENIVNGIPYKSQKVVNDTEFVKIAEDINKTLKFRGAWFFQLKEDKNNKLKLLEICVRQAGTMNYFREYGFNFPALTLFDFMGQDIKPIINDFNIILNRCLHNSFKFVDFEFNNIYIDFDDTIIVKNKVNTTAIKFLFQSINNDKKIYLLTKHANEIEDTLKYYHIDKYMFSEIIHLNEDESKYKKINPYKSIFIDNYFKERYEVYENLHIPVFDVDAIECLIDESEL